MNDFYKPFEERTPDSQYRDRVKFILDNGELVKDTPQGIGALTCFGTLPQMIFDLSNGAPLITDRKIGFWRKPVVEILSFMSGVRSIQKLREAGCDYWKDYIGKGVKLGLDPDDLGPGSYGGAFHDFPRPEGGALNQYAQLLGQIKNRPDLRTHLITPWIPFYTARGPDKKVVVVPCHGWQQYRIIGDRIDLVMWQRSADFPIGVPSNMIQYAAVLLMVARATGFRPGRFIHQFGDAHIYADQIDHMKELVEREPRILPTLRLSEEANSFFDTTISDFSIADYDPHPAMPGIPYRP